MALLRSLEISDAWAAAQPQVQPSCHTRAPTVTSALKHLTKLGVARETTGRNYGRIYAYDKYLRILNEETEPLN